MLPCRGVFALVLLHTSDAKPMPAVVQADAFTFQQVHVHSTWEHCMYMSTQLFQLLIGQGLMCMQRNICSLTGSACCRIGCMMM